MQPAWSLDPDALRKFERGCDDACTRLQRVMYAGRAGDQIMYVADVDVPFFAATQLTLLVDAASTEARPKVYAADLRKMRHQFADKRLCLWYPYDPPERRWVFDDGLAKLIEVARVHLYREERYRETGRWIGPEAPHLLPEPPGVARGAADGKEASHG